MVFSILPCTCKSSYFFYGILVYSKELDNHLVPLEHVLITLHENHLFDKYSKCCFSLLQIEYVGYIVSVTKVQMDQAKIEPILQWPKPTNIKQLRGFLWISGYYR